MSNNQNVRFQSGEGHRIDNKSLVSAGGDS